MSIKGIRARKGAGNLVGSVARWISKCDSGALHCDESERWSVQRVFPGFALVLDGIKVAARGWTRESEDNSRPLTKRVNVEWGRSGAFKKPNMSEVSGDERMDATL
uniref:Uncharacterized protein n=1 Tax=Vespula pensylvanica TaxID=30213 RepID=A0A834PAH9_VESPE|nr:hypothetical protein H0235_002636 [Vespula pensylvanica]